MPLTSADKDQIRRMLDPEEILSPGSEEYIASSTCWVANLDRKPELVLQPRSLEALQRAIEFLCGSSLDFAVRSTGVGSSSAGDVIVSLSEFNAFSFNPDEETVLLGAGQKWGNVYRRLEDEAPGYAGKLVEAVMVPILLAISENFLRQPESVLT